VYHILNQNNDNENNIDYIHLHISVYIHCTYTTFISSKYIESSVYALLLATCKLHINRQTKENFLLKSSLPRYTVSVGEVITYKGVGQR